MFPSLDVLDGMYNEPITGVAFSPDNIFLLTYGGYHAQIWRINTKSVMTTISHEKGITVAKFNPQSSSVATAAADGSIKIWQDEREVANMVGHTKKIHALEFSPDGALIFTGSDDKLGMLWGATAVEGTCNYRLEHSVAGHSKGVRSVAFGGAREEAAVQS